MNDDPADELFAELADLDSEAALRLRAIVRGCLSSVRAGRRVEARRRLETGLLTYRCWLDSR